MEIGIYWNQMVFIEMVKIAYNMERYALFLSTE